MFLGALVLIVGVVWLLNNLAIISADVWQVILPAAVILAGFAMMGKHCNCGKCWFCKSRMMHRGCCCGKCDKCEKKPEEKM